MADPTASTTTDTIKKMNNFKCLSWLETAEVFKQTIKSSDLMGFDAFKRSTLHERFLLEVICALASLIILPSIMSIVEV